MTEADKNEYQRRIEAAKIRREKADDEVYQKTQDDLIEQLEGRLVAAEQFTIAPVSEVAPQGKKKEKAAMEVEG